MVGVEGLGYIVKTEPEDGAGSRECRRGHDALDFVRRRAGDDRIGVCEWYTFPACVTHGDERVEVWHGHRDVSCA